MRMPARRQAGDTRWTVRSKNPGRRLSRSGFARHEDLHDARKRELPDADAREELFFVAHPET